MTAAGTPAGRGGPARPGQAAAERAGPALQKTAASSPGRSHSVAGTSGGSRTASRTGYPGQRPAALAPPLALQQKTPRGSELWGPHSPASRPRYASALCLQLGPVLPALAGPLQDGVGASPPSRAMGRPLGTEQPPEA